MFAQILRSQYVLSEYVSKQDSAKYLQGQAIQNKARCEEYLKIEYSKKAAKYISALDRTTKQRIKAGIEGLTEQPPKGDIQALQGYSDGRKRLRIGKYRIIYNYTSDGRIEILYIINVDSRGDIYK